MFSTAVMPARRVVLVCVSVSFQLHFGRRYNMYREGRLCTDTDPVSTSGEMGGSILALVGSLIVYLTLCARYFKAHVR